MAIAASNWPFWLSDVAVVKIASVAAGSCFGLDMNFVQPNHPAAASTAMMTTPTTARIAVPPDAEGAGRATFAAGLRAEIGEGEDGGTSGAVVGMSSAKTSDGAEGGVNGAANPVAPPSVGSSSMRPM